MADLLHRSDPARLRRALVVFFLVLALPTGTLAWLAWNQLEFETFFEYRSQAEDLTTAIDRRLAASAATLAQRDPEDFRFFRTPEGDPAGIVERSPLAARPPPGDLPGLLGYFQIDPSGELSSPLVPRSAQDAARAGLSEDELRSRRALLGELRRILSGNRAADSVTGAGAGSSEVHLFADAEPAAASLGKLEDLSLDADLQQKSERLEQRSATGADAGRAAESQRPSPARRTTPAAPASALDESAPDADALVTFAPDTTPLRFGFIGGDHGVLYRDVWQNGGRYVQGALLDRDAFLEAAIVAAWRQSGLAAMSNLVIGYGEDVIRIVGGDSGSRYPTVSSDLDGSLLHRARLASPFGRMELVMSVRQLPPGPAAGVLGWTTAVAGVVLVCGFLLLYRVGLRQIRLAGQQQDFVAAVSHELKTPLTSIRMYGEMLQSGWVDEERRQQYYGYIHDESERLTRLVDNVLQLARISRAGLKLDLKPLAVADLADLLETRTADQAARAGIELRIACDPSVAAAAVRVDADCFLQVAINLIDNAIKFAGTAADASIDCRFAPAGDNDVLFCVRDYGPGITKQELRRIFEPFYRTESELTRETAGTGIGLAIVHSLVQAMGGSVDVVNRHPGSEFRVTLPRLPATADAASEPVPPPH